MEHRNFDDFLREQGVLGKVMEWARFQAVVMICFDNTEFLSNWERLRKKRCHGDKAMKLFIRDVKDIVWDRLPIEVKSPNVSTTKIENPASPSSEEETGNFKDDGMPGRIRTYGV